MKYFLVLICAICFSPVSSFGQSLSQASPTPSPSPILVDSFTAVHKSTGDRFAIAQLVNNEGKPLGFTMVVEGDEEYKAFVVHLQWSNPLFAPREIRLERVYDDIIAINEFATHQRHRPRHKSVGSNQVAVSLFELADKFFRLKFHDPFPPGRVPPLANDPLAPIFTEIIKLSGQKFPEEWDLEKNKAKKGLIAHDRPYFFIQTLYI